MAHSLIKVETVEPFQLDDFPDEIMLMILKKVEIIHLSGANYPSFIGMLYECKSCEYEKVKCNHLHTDEREAIINLMLVCKKWYWLIRSMNFSNFNII